jgi:dCMP deaminase
MAINTWDERYLALAMQVSQWSKDPSSQMGAVISDSKGRMVALGYNGFPAKVHNLNERWHNKNKKYEMVVHAEANAALIAGGAALGGTVYVYGPRPICGPCAGILIQAGVKRAVAIPPPCEGTPMNPGDEKWVKSGRLAIKMFKEAKVTFEPVNDDKTAVEETFLGLIKWANHRGFEQIVCKLRDAHGLVTATLLDTQPLFRSNGTGPDLMP